MGFEPKDAGSIPAGSVLRNKYCYGFGNLYPPSGTRSSNLAPSPATPFSVTSIPVIPGISRARNRLKPVFFTYSSIYIQNIEYFVEILHDLRRRILRQPLIQFTVLFACFSCTFSGSTHDRLPEPGELLFESPLFQDTEAVFTIQYIRYNSIFALFPCEKNERRCDPVPPEVPEKTDLIRYGIKTATNDGINMIPGENITCRLQQRSTGFNGKLPTLLKEVFTDPRKTVIVVNINYGEWCHVFIIRQCIKAGIFYQESPVYLFL